jgi:cytochrome c peroxidase
MTGVYTDQTSSFLAGNLSAHGATGGVQNLLALSQSASRPCVFDEDTPTPDLTPFVEAVATPDSCTPVVVGGEIANPPGPPTFTLFDAWANLPNNRDNAGRLSVARGQAVFNKTNCVNCHTVPNLGNNASAGAPGFKNIGTDSLSVLATVKAAATTPAEAQLVQDMIDRVSQLPLYCLRLTTDHNPNACGTDPTDTTDVVTTDPGRALVTGNIADAGSFKPPILRDLPVRAPFFHAGAAPDMKHLVNYYNLRFKLGLSASEQADLVNFLNAL